MNQDLDVQDPDESLVPNFIHNFDNLFGINSFM